MLQLDSRGGPEISINNSGLSKTLLRTCRLHYFFTACRAFTVVNPRTTTSKCSAKSFPTLDRAFRFSFAQACNPDKASITACVPRFPNIVLGKSSSPSNRAYPCISIKHIHGSIALVLQHLRNRVRCHVFSQTSQHNIDH